MQLTRNTILENLMKLPIGRLAAVALLAGAPVIALAHNGATGIVGERMMAMMMLGEQVKTLVPAVESGAVTQTQIDTAAKMILMHSGEAMTNLFPEGSIEGPSEASPAIWKEWAAFSAYADRLEQLGRLLQQAEARVETVAAAPVNAANQPSEWERLSYAALLGAAPNPLINSGEQAGEATAPERPRVSEIVRSITSTCSGCHADFRR